MREWAFAVFVKAWYVIPHGRTVLVRARNTGCIPVADAKLSVKLRGTFVDVHLVKRNGLELLFSRNPHEVQ